MKFIDPQLAFKEYFTTDKDREQYMYMYSKDNTHYFKHIDTRAYIKVFRQIK